jgi:hypothetical protein
MLREDGRTILLDAAPAIPISSGRPGAAALLRVLRERIEQQLLAAADGETSP